MFLRGVSPGETIVPFNEGRPFAHVRPLTHVTNQRKWPLGIYKGKFTVPDAFKDPLPDEVIATFYVEEES